MKKIAALLFSVLLSCFLLYASVTEGTNNLLKLKTKHFEIIYRRESASTASLIYNSCEDIYSQICGILESDPNLFLPVVITDRRYVLNAYFSQYPYNRIVIYDTLSQIDQLTNYKESVLGIFRHELVHAVHINTKGPFWQFLSHFIPGISPQNLYSTPAVTEGTAVMIESLAGYGRLNDSSYIQQILQAKKENRFPSELQASGARDIYPVDFQYLYGGSFINWLRTSYSQEQVNNFLHLNGKLRFATTYGNFKSSFGTTLNQAWSSFTDSFADINTTESRHISEKKSLFSILTNTEKGIFCYDTLCNQFFRINDDGSFTHILFQGTSYPELGLTPDGMYIIPMVSQKERRLYVTDGIRTDHIFDDSRAGVSVKKNGESLIVVFSEHQRHSFIDTYNTEYEKIASYDLGYGVSVSGFCTLDDSRCAFLSSDCAECSIIIFDPFNQECIQFRIPGAGILRSLSSYRNTLVFSFADTFTCAGTAEIIADKAIVRLSDKFFSGGVKYPVKTKDGDFIFISDFSQYSMLSTASEYEFDFGEPFTVEASGYKAPQEIPVTVENGEKYNPLMYFGRFSLLPVAISPEYSLTGDIGFGLTYITQDPTETWSLGASSGYNPKENHGFSYITVSNTKMNIPFSVGFHITYPDFSYDFSFSSAWTKVLRSSAEYIKISDYATYLRDKDCNKTFSNTLNAGYSYTRSTGLKATDYTGFEALASFVYYQRKQNGLYGPGFKFASRVHIPHLLLPHSYITAGMQTSLKSDLTAYGELTVVPLCIEIQNGFIDIYFNRFVMTADYKCVCTPSCGAFSHTVSGNAYLTLSPKIGSLTGSKADLGVGVSYTFGDSSVTVRPFVAFEI